MGTYHYCKLLQGKRVCIEKIKNRGLKLKDQILKINERVIEKLIRQ